MPRKTRIRVVAHFSNGDNAAQAISKLKHRKTLLCKSIDIELQREQCQSMAAQTEDLADLRKRLLELQATIDHRIKENEELMNKIDNWKFHFENLAVKPLY